MRNCSKIPYDAIRVYTGGVISTPASSFIFAILKVATDQPTAVGQRAAKGARYRDSAKRINVTFTHVASTRPYLRRCKDDVVWLIPVDNILDTYL